MSDSSSTAAAEFQPPSDPFAPFSATADQPWDLRRVGHLLRRAGFGPTDKRIAAMLKQSPAEAVDSVFAFDVADDPFNGMIDQMEGLFNLNQVDSVQRWWIYRMINTPRPLQEKVALFWHNRFATSAAKVENGQYMHNHIALFRQKALGSFRDLL